MRKKSGEKLYTQDGIIVLDQSFDKEQLFRCNKSWDNSFEPSLG